MKKHEWAVQGFDNREALQAGLTTLTAEGWIVCQVFDCSGGGGYDFTVVAQRYVEVKGVCSDPEELGHNV